MGFPCSSGGQGLRSGAEIEKHRSIRTPTVTHLYQDTHKNVYLSFTNTHQLYQCHSTCLLAHASVILQALEPGFSQ